MGLFEYLAKRRKDKMYEILLAVRSTKDDV